MPISTGELIANIEDSHSFPEVEEWRRYLMANKEYYQSDMREIIDVLTDAEIRYSPGCPTRLTFTYYGERGNLQFYTPSQDEMTRFCNVSKRRGIPLIQVIYNTFPDLAKHTSMITRSGEVYEKYYRRPPPEELGPPPIEKEFTEEMERRPRKPRREEYYPEEEREEISPYREVATKRERKVEILRPEFTPEEFLRRQEAYEEELRELHEELERQKFKPERRKISVMRGKIPSSELDSVVDHLCANYEKRTGLPCGLSGKGALKTLAERLIEYANAHGTEWDKMFDIASLNLFPGGESEIRRIREKHIYTSEMADEAFNSIISAIEGRNIIQSRRLEEMEACEPEILQGDILDYDAISVIEHDHLMREIPVTLLNIKGDAIRALQRCGYYPNRLDELRNEANTVFRSYGTDYNTQLDARIESYIDRYGA